jgi:hypothetical protein
MTEDFRLERHALRDIVWHLLELSDLSDDAAVEFTDRIVGAVLENFYRPALADALEDAGLAP